LPVLSYAQSGSPKDIEIWITKNNTAVIYGLGISEFASESDAMRQATLLAFENLAGNLSISIESALTDMATSYSNNDTKQYIEQIEMVIKQKVEATIENAKTVGPYINGKGNTYIIKYILKEDARLLYESRIQTYKQVLELLLAVSRQEKEALYKSGTLRRAVQVADIVEKNIQLLQGIDPSKKYPEIISLVQEVRSSYKNSRSSISFNVVVRADNEKVLPNDIQTEIANLLEQNDYIINRNHPIYTITADITTREEQPSGYHYYVNANIAIEMLNADGTKLFPSYNKLYERSRSRLSWNQAYKEAEKKIRDDMPNFITHFITFIER
jgi:hypothetical protein